MSKENRNIFFAAVEFPLVAPLDRQGSVEQERGEGEATA